MSAGTLKTYTSATSQPTEPLLFSPSIDSAAYNDILTRQPLHPSGRRPNWQTALSLEGDPASFLERKGFWEKNVRRRLRVLKWLKVSMEGIMTTWAVYNTVRYFLAFTVYNTVDAQAVAVVLGTTTAVSFTLFTCAFILAVCHNGLVAHHTPVHVLVTARIVFRSLAGFLLLIPAIVNIILVAIWRNSTMPELGVMLKCHLDIDLVWTASEHECDPPQWIEWLALAISRSIVTLVFIALHYICASAYHATRRPSLQRRRHQRSKSSNGSQDIPASALPSPPPTIMTSRSNAPVSLSNLQLPSPSRLSTRDKDRSREPSATLDLTGANGSLSPDRSDAKSIKSSKSKSRPNSGTRSRPSSAGSTRDTARDTRIADTLEFVEATGAGPGGSPSVVTNDVEPMGSVASTSARTLDQPPAFPPGLSHHTPTVPDPTVLSAISSTEERELNIFATQFRTLVAQISHEVEDAMRYSIRDNGSDAIPRSDSPSTMESSEEDEIDLINDPSTAIIPPSQRTRILYDEFGIPYSSETFDHVRILNGYVRRMPTIESMSSREITSAASSPVREQNDHLPSIHNVSRPPTRANTLNGSEPPTRANSLRGTPVITHVVPGGALVGPAVSELGEMLTERMIRRGNNGSRSSGSGSSSGSSGCGGYGTGVESVGSGSTSGHSHSGHSYHTAPAPVVEERPISPTSTTSGYGHELPRRFEGPYSARVVRDDEFGTTRSASSA